MPETAKKGGRPANDSKTKSKKQTQESTEAKFITIPEDQFERLLKSFGQAQNANASKPSEDRKNEKELRATFAKKTNLRHKQAQEFFQLMSTDRKNLRTIEIPKMYQDHVGSHVTATVNGLTVKVPADSRRYPIHQAHYEAIRNKLRYIEENRERNRGNDNFFQDQGDYSKVSTNQ